MSVQESKRQVENAQAFMEEERGIMVARISALNETMNQKTKTIISDFLRHRVQDMTYRKFNFVYHGMERYLLKTLDYNKKIRKDELKKWWMNQKASEMAKDLLPLVLATIESYSKYIVGLNDIKNYNFEQYVLFELLETALLAHFRRPRASASNCFPNTSFQYTRSELRKRLASYFDTPYLIKNGRDVNKNRAKKEWWLKLIQEKRDYYKAQYMDLLVKRKKSNNDNDNYNNKNNNNNNNNHFLDIPANESVNMYANESPNYDNNNNNNNNRSNNNSAMPSEMSMSLPPMVDECNHNNNNIIHNHNIHPSNHISSTAMVLPPPPNTHRCDGCVIKSKQINQLINEIRRLQNELNEYSKLLKTALVEKQNAINELKNYEQECQTMRSKSYSQKRRESLSYMSVEDKSVHNNQINNNPITLNQHITPLENDPESNLISPTYEIQSAAGSNDIEIHSVGHEPNNTFNFNQQTIQNNQNNFNFDQINHHNNHNNHNHNNNNNIHSQQPTIKVSPSHRNQNNSLNTNHCSYIQAHNLTHPNYNNHNHNNHNNNNNGLFQQPWIKSFGLATNVQNGNNNNHFHPNQNNQNYQNHQNNQSNYNNHNNLMMQNIIEMKSQTFWHTQNKNQHEILNQVQHSHPNNNNNMPNVANIPPLAMNQLPLLPDNMTNADMLCPTQININNMNDLLSFTGSGSFPGSFPSSKSLNDLKLNECC